MTAAVNPHSTSTPGFPPTRLALSAYARALRLAWKVVAEQGLDLSGLTVLTEAATGWFALTGPLAILAGARRVIAAAADSRHGTWHDAARATQLAARCFGASERLEVLPRDAARQRAGEADIVTNLGPVRPIDADLVHRLKPTAAVSLMWETWEFRPGEVDLNALVERSIPILGTDETRAGVFPWVGALVLKQLWQAGVAVRGSRIAVLGNNPFRAEVVPRLGREGAEVVDDGDLAALDAVVLLDYPDPVERLTEPGTHPPRALAERSPGVVVVQFSGSSKVDRAVCDALGLPVWPVDEVPEGRMAETLAALGPAPVLRLHGAGLAVGAALARARMRGLDVPEAVAEALRTSPAQGFPPELLPHLGPGADGSDLAYAD